MLVIPNRLTQVFSEDRSHRRRKAHHEAMLFPSTDPMSEDINGYGQLITNLYTARRLLSRTGEGGLWCVTMLVRKGAACFYRLLRLIN